MIKWWDIFFVYFDVCDCARMKDGSSRFHGGGGGGGGNADDDDNDDDDDDGDDDVMK